MEGWNDCPPVMLQKNISSTSMLVNTSPTLVPETKLYANDIAANVDIAMVVEELTSFPTSIPEKMLGQIKVKLTKASESMSSGSKQFVTEVLEQIKTGADSAILKSSIVEYMMVNDGVSSWCAPLKKLVDSIDT
ncbi:hypothetical protein CANTEDRAFT_92070 [Yamadazyma tenuis ATCC 10573]|uniref:Uncharacterized protein n=2 Tax=Candida tenuis TaxID=2315449 RepID=G3AY10_CANTC|nr:uncharacterized protein CANTEDRAFT_92070 [Yamadazyma tenuis ATCC 10573]EGV65744.1 hypothetical protein CANTEDRAFT_92070 [Yamadazyma tenuis ATCC 10573]